MGFWKNFFKGWYYVIDLPTLKTYLEGCGQFAQEERLELGGKLTLFDSHGKHQIMVCNPAASVDEDMWGAGLLFTYDDMEFPSLDMLVSQKLRFLPPYFKIHLEDGDDVFLNEYKANHPELRVEDY